MTVLVKRTTVKARAEALETLADEARRREVSLSDMIAEAVEEKAAALRRCRRPRFGLGSSGGRSPGARIVAADPIAEPPRS